METEIELKFFVSPDFARHVRDKTVELKVLQHSHRHLGNIYYDTPDLQLRHSDIGLRVRRDDDIYVQTLKTAGRVVAGLHQRPEYNDELIGPTPDISLLPVDVWPDNIVLDTLSSSLIPLFSTDFERQQWLVVMPDSSQIELAYDQGKVATEQGGFDPISEIEIELKSGQTSAIFSLARELAAHGGLRLGSLSKAARGYRLFSGYEGDDVRPLTAVALQPEQSTEQAFIDTLEHALAHWHYHEQIYVERPDLDALQQICQSVALLRQVLVLYGGLIPRRASALLRQELQWLEGELSWIDEARALERLLEDKAHFLRKLNSQKVLKKRLKKMDEALPDRSALLELLHSSRYCNLLLDLSCWLLTQGWRPFLNEKSRRKLAAPIKDFANKVLDQSWEELLAAFGTANAFDRYDYYDQQARFQRNLLTDICIATFYDEDRRHAFRLPWLDLLQGIEDLHLLELVRALRSTIDRKEDATQLDKWLRRKEESLLHAMQQSRAIGVSLTPYWYN